MAKKSMIAREKKRQRLAAKYLSNRIQLKKEMRTVTTFEDKFKTHQKLQLLPLNSSPTRLKNRCIITGRSRGYYRFFGVSRHVLRNLAHRGLLPGVRKASW